MTSALAGEGVRARRWIRLSDGARACDKRCHSACWIRRISARLPLSPADHAHRLVRLASVRSRSPHSPSLAAQQPDYAGRADAHLEHRAARRHTSFRHLALDSTRSGIASRGGRPRVRLIDPVANTQRPLFDHLSSRVRSPAWKPESRTASKLPFRPSRSSAGQTLRFKSGDRYISAISRATSGG